MFFKTLRAALFCLLTSALLSGTMALAEEIKKFPQPRITAEQWRTFFEEVKAKPGARNISRPDRPDVVVIAVPAEHAVYYFTKPGPAHPAVVIAQVIQQGTVISIRHTGYFAGSEEAFARWFGAFKSRPTRP